MSADVETGQLLLHSLVLDGVDERVHADVEVGEEQCGVVAGVQGGRRLLRVIDNDPVER